MEEFPTLIHRSVRGKLPALTAALEAPLGEVLRRLLGIALKHLRELGEHIKDVEALIATQLEPHQDSLKLLMAIPDISLTAASIILAEVGVDISHWRRPRSISQPGQVSPLVAARVLGSGWDPTSGRGTTT